MSYSTVSLALFGRKRRRKDKGEKKKGGHTTSIDVQDSVREVMTAVCITEFRVCYKQTINRTDDGGQVRAEMSSM